MTIPTRSSLLVLLLSSCLGTVAFAGNAKPSDAGTVRDTVSPVSKSTPSEEALKTPNADFKAACLETLAKTTRPASRDRLSKYCERREQIPTCASTEGRAITHSDFTSTDPRGKKILVLGLIHGDEPLAGEMALDWAERLHDLREKKIEPRNSWRVVPMLNPDGLERKTRMNARGVDLNRNFPTKDWSEEATQFWKSKAGADPRRFPGDQPASEAETKCAIAHIKDFKPDFILSVHTPYHVLDFDGPKMPFPVYKDLPWRALGNFPGSLGRYMWRDYQIPVLTVELGQSMVDSAALQDIVGTFAIDAARRSGQKTASLYDLM
ncbi:MAG: M14 family zinc carboxypeptidase [Bdellovibrionota bacterium]